ncbi:uncharacterized protein A4U43_C01F25270 [Asparagus officinalis]|uniref:Retrotransposon Copia-like N-terminal domain-containing protein n=1 Tax=Asparagus officinalis TaxID=4686 RepID=A0A5P1FVF8_ASPOF|nr:uncharacterized protein A4U43_C01F25270 [Asparagus officinalis]
MASGNGHSSTSTSSSSGSSTTFSVATAVKHAYHYITLKLKPDNYLYWHTLIHPFLSSQSLLGFFDGTSTFLPSNILSADQSSSTVNPNFALWKQNDEHMKTNILSSLSEECFPTIVGKETSTDIWSVLVIVYANPLNSRALQIHEELLEC